MKPVARLTDLHDCPAHGLNPELEARYQVVTVKPCAIVCVIGSNIAIPGVLARAAQAMAEAKVNVNCISQTLRQVNMQFLVDREDYKPAIIALNRALCLPSRAFVPLGCE